MKVPTVTPRRLVPCLLLLALSGASPSMATDADGDGAHDEPPVTLYSTSFDTADAGWSYGNWTRTSSTPTRARTQPWYVYTNCFSFNCSNTFTMSLAYDVPQAARISFWGRSTATVTQSLSFFIDNVKKQTFSLYSGGYSQVSFPVGMGLHTFKWSGVPASSGYGGSGGPLFVDDVSIVSVQDNCPAIPNPDQLDTDKDALGNVCDSDDDGDGIEDAVDNCVVATNSSQLDSDGDGEGDACDTDDDNDGVNDAGDRFPLDPTEWQDNDNDGTGNNADTDDDNDGVPDTADNCPFYGAIVDQTDTDSDGQGDVCDSDDDNDGAADNTDTYPQDATRTAIDTGILHHFYGDSMGYDVSGGADFNNDGVEDIVASAPLTTGTYAGTLRAYSGSDGRILWQVTGADGDQLGMDVSVAGDVNADGYDDVIAGAIGDGNGTVKVFSGLNGSTIRTYTGIDAQEYFGRAVGAVGDINGDGYDDVIAGSDLNGTAGNARVYSGRTGAILFTLNGETAGDRFGASVSGAGDVNADGVPDFVVGSCSYSTTSAYTGKVTVFSGANGSVLYSWLSGSAVDYIGCAVSAAGDVNNDGYADVVAGIYNRTTSHGGARVYSGSDGSVLYDFSRNYGGSSYQVSGVGDVNSDGHDDVALVDGSTYSGGIMGGSAVFSGATGALLYVTSAASNVSAAGDVDADGYADFVIGYSSDATRPGMYGVVRVYSGKALWNDADLDGQSDAADTDDDADSTDDLVDDYPRTVAFSDDADHDRMPSAWNAGCDAVCQAGAGLPLDNCPALFNPYQQDSDSDNAGDACDSDNDNDGVDDAVDAFPLNPAAYEDSDIDGFPGGWAAGCDASCQGSSGLELDNCPSLHNPDQQDTDADSIGNACDPDDDNDTVEDSYDAFPLNAGEWRDTDRDGTGNNADPDDDNDGLADASDNCPLVGGGSQQDSDGDGKGDQCDLAVKPARALAAGESHTCAIDHVGGLHCWGSNNYGQLGNNSTLHSAVPVPVSGLASGVVAVAAGRRHTCALLADSAVKCWGYADGVGDGSLQGRLVPSDVINLGAGVRDIAAGWNHSCVALVDGKVKCWGYGYGGTPASVAGISGATGLEAGGNHICAVSESGAAWCWIKGGDNSLGQVGNGTASGGTVPALVSGLSSGAVSVVAGYSHGCSLGQDGRGYCWGGNGSGQVGDGTTTHRLAPVLASSPGGALSLLAAGYAHTCAALPLGGMRCWGNNSSGQLGDGTQSNRVTAVPVAGLDTVVTAIGLGDNHSCALDASGNIRCWGYNAFGQLGNGNTALQGQPVSVAGTFHVADLDGDGVNHALDDDDDGDGVPDYIDAVPLDAGAGAEFVLPLDGGYRGVRQAEQVDSGG